MHDFQHRYRIATGLHLVTTDSILAYELPRILRRPKPDLLEHANAFLRQHNVSLPFDLTLNFRQCVDCGWTMSLTTILRDLRCAMKHVKLPHNATIFIAMDTRNHLDNIIAALPPSARIVENIPTEFIHTTNGATHHKREKELLPYLDVFLGGAARVVGSCFTSYGRTMVFAQRVTQRVIAWQHHDDKPNSTSRCEVIDINSLTSTY